MIRDSQPFRIAACAGLLWVAFQTAMMLYSRNLTIGAAALNIIPVLILSIGAFRANTAATIALAVYGALRLWMAVPILSSLVEGGSTMPKHWWIALVAVPFAWLWMLAGYQAQRFARRSARSR